MKRTCTIMSALLVFAIALAFISARVSAQEGYFGDQAPPSATVAVAQPSEPEIALRSVTKIGHLTLQPGHYAVQHRVDGRNHYIHFTKIEQSLEVHPETSVTAYAYDAGNAKCEMKPLAQRASRAAVTKVREGDVSRITRLEIPGDKFAHLF